MGGARYSACISKRLGRHAHRLHALDRDHHVALSVSPCSPQSGTVARGQAGSHPPPEVRGQEVAQARGPSTPCASCPWRHYGVKLFLRTLSVFQYCSLVESRCSVRCLSEGGVGPKRGGSTEHEGSWASAAERGLSAICLAPTGTERGWSVYRAGCFRFSSRTVFTADHALDGATPRVMVHHSALW